ncbi:MAG: hypothetical protein Q7R90_01600 [bacterium]|nr:hypothetical protein [bacterium]
MFRLSKALTVLGILVGSLPVAINLCANIILSLLGYDCYVAGYLTLRVEDTYCLIGSIDIGPLMHEAIGTVFLSFISIPLGLVILIAALIVKLLANSSQKIGQPKKTQASHLLGAGVLTIFLYLLVSIGGLFFTSIEGHGYWTIKPPVTQNR